MNRIPVTSTNIAEVGYEEETATLEVVFHHGGAYQYFDVPEIVYRELMSAESKGSYLNHFIRNFYRSARL